METYAADGGKCMKGKRFAALLLAVVLTMSLLVVPAGAVSFTDMQGHWAQEDVEYLAGLGIVKGTTATTFAPAQKMTACEALLFCSRARASKYSRPRWYSSRARSRLAWPPSVS